MLVGTEIPERMVKRIDALVTEGYTVSRSEFVRQAAIQKIIEVEGASAN